MLTIRRLARGSTVTRLSSRLVEAQSPSSSSVVIGGHQSFHTCPVRLDTSWRVPPFPDSPEAFADQRPAPKHSSEEAEREQLAKPKAKKMPVFRIKKVLLKQVFLNFFFKNSVEQKLTKFHNSAHFLHKL